jgi:hypothetical protein
MLFAKEFKSVAVSDTVSNYAMEDWICREEGADRNRQYVATSIRTSLTSGLQQYQSSNTEASDSPTCKCKGDAVCAIPSLPRGLLGADS